MLLSLFGTESNFADSLTFSSNFINIFINYLRKCWVESNVLQFVFLTRKNIQKRQSLIHWKFHQTAFITLWQEKWDSLVIGQVVDKECEEKNSIFCKIVRYHQKVALSVNHFSSKITILNTAKICRDILAERRVTGEFR